MKTTPSPHLRRPSQRKQEGNPGNEVNVDAKQAYHKKNQSALNYIKAAAKKFAGVFSSFRPRKKTAFKGAPATPDGSRNFGQAPGISLFRDISTSKNKSPSNFKQSDASDSFNAASGELVTKNFSIEEIYKATQNFSPANKIGEGGFGTVYKGRLRNGSLVAIKRAKKNLYDRRLSQEFKNEILTLSGIEHLNLVKLIGYLEHKDERIIIVEYVGNGTLREHLDGTQRNGLEIAERLDIAIDVAHAIAYLHMYTDTPIIHRDIKASNILITEKFRAKVADFGFARLAAEDPGATHISTQIKGTAGYLDPEYLRTYQLTEKSDVYSFGVLLVEMVTGRRPLESARPLNERVTARWAMERLKEGDAIVAMDPKLRRSPASNQAVEKVLKLARQCIVPLRQSRPSMRRCAEVLWTIRKEFREKALSLSPPPTSHRSDNFLNKHARKNRHPAFGLEDSDSYKFVSA